MLTVNKWDSLSNEALASYHKRFGPIVTEVDDSDYESAVPLELTVDVPIKALSLLSEDPGTFWFPFWYFISAYFPLISACLGPFANSLSIIGLIEHWRVDLATGLGVNEKKHVLEMNITSLVLGLLGNMSLLMNFAGKSAYIFSQIVSVLFYITASVLLVIALLITNTDFLGPDPLYGRTEGFWFAVFTSGFYFACSVCLTINFLGYLLGKYPPTFNLDVKQRRLMYYTVMFCTWCVIGTVVLHKLFHQNYLYGSMLYYCIVSFLTIGLGDIVPKTNASKGVALAMSLVGVILMGLIVALIRQVVLSTIGPTLFWHSIEKNRKKCLKTLSSRHRKLTAEASFYRMRLIRKEAKISQLNRSLLNDILFFLVFWFVGACVFHFTEQWAFFDAIYFCFLCLLTIGYGDYAPVSPLGRVFFVSWAVSAVPLMTILISNAGDKLFAISENMNEFIKKYLSIQSRSARTEINERISSGIIYGDGDESDLESEIRRDFDMTATGQDEGNDGDHTAAEGGMPTVSRSQTLAELENLLQSIAREPGAPSEDYVVSKEDWQQVKEKIDERLQKRQALYRSIFRYIKALKPLIADSMVEPHKRYEHSEWLDLMKLYEDEAPSPQPALANGRAPVEDELRSIDSAPVSAAPTTNTKVTPFDIRNSANFWLSDESPLRLPLQEPNYLIMKLFFKMDQELNELIDIDVGDMALISKLAYSELSSDTQRTEAMNEILDRRKIQFAS
ncbi:Potassium channel [Scheffersomyces spartinae]|uniref:Potassium channel n=1 Tax=Scheffersomyces spartinae TaxID=45513 RepID=A0A9P8AJA6_9ASCO|nr:Potassium channel [Scheffersomyces spartinae]KAG7193967.1 Potassium channel [Scheffersomyces spartinae]